MTIREAARHRREAALMLYQLQFAEQLKSSRHRHTHYYDRNLRHDLARFWKLPTIERLKTERAASGYAVAEMPTLWLRRCTKLPRTLGTARPTHQHIQLSIFPGLLLPRLVAVLLHEVVHCALPDTEAHSLRFWLRLQDATREAWPNIVFPHSLVFGSVGERNQRHIETVAAYVEAGGVL